MHKVIAVDGKYKGFGKSRGSKLSDDGSREIIEKWGKRFGFYDNKVAMAYCAGVPEFSKRQMYVDVAAWCNADFLLILDSDEYIKARWGHFMEELKLIKELAKEDGKICNVAMLDVEQQDYKPMRPRLWYRPEQFFYDDKHNQISRRDRKATGIKFDISTELIEIIHSKKDCRSQIRQEQQQDYEYRLEGLEKSNTSHV